MFFSQILFFDSDANIPGVPRRFCATISFFSANPLRPWRLCDIFYLFRFVSSGPNLNAALARWLEHQRESGLVGVIHFPRDAWNRARACAANPSDRSRYGWHTGLV